MRNLLILAKWLAGRADVDVIEYVGVTACIGIVNGRRVIKIPSHWSYSTDPDAAELLEGVIDHEALGHGRFTDLEGRQKAEQSGIIKFTNLSASIHNILEDIYIENKAIETYPGVKANLARMVEILVGRGFFGSPDGFAHSEGPNLLTAGLLNILRCKLVPGQEKALKENADALEIVLTGQLGQLWIDILAIGMEVQTSTSTADNILLTVRIMKVIEEAAHQDPQEAGDGEQKPDQTNGSADDEPENGSAQPNQPASEQSGDAQAAEDSGDPGDSPDGREPSSCPGEEPGATVECQPLGCEQAEAESSDAVPSASPGGKRTFSSKEVESAKDIIESQDDVMPVTEIGDAISDEIQKFAQCTAKRDLSETDRKTPVSATSMRVASQVKSVSDELQEALLAETKCEKSTRFVGKSLNNRVLSRVRLGNSRVFRQKHEGIGLSTAVQFVVDMSSSMILPLEDSVSRLDAAIGLAYGMGDILDEYEVPFQINTYSESYATLKSFEDDWSQIRKKKEQPHINGGTYTGLAVQKALSDLVVRQEDRKLLMVITDGDTSDLDVLMSCYAEAQMMGIEVASVMIGPKVLSIESLASKFGFKATNIESSNGLGRFAVQRILEAL